MAGISLPKPGSELGPCVERCGHIDCAETRQVAERICPVCKKPIGYETRIWLVGRQLKHSACSDA